MGKETKAQLMKRLDTQSREIYDLRQEVARMVHCGEQLTLVSKDYLRLQDDNRKLEKQRDEWEHLAESVIDGVRQTLNNDTKMYHDHHNTYYAMWYWVEWGTKVNTKMKKENN